MKTKKIIYSCLLLILVGFVIYIYIAFNGNPISKYYAQKTLINYLSEEYPEREFRVDETFYNFKFSEYVFTVIEIGSSNSSNKPNEYSLSVAGFFKPQITNDDIYNSNLDEELMERIGREAEQDIFHVLQSKIPSVKEISIILFIEKGEVPEETKWSKEIKWNKPFTIHMHVDATKSTDKEFFTIVKEIQTIFTNEGYQYEYVSVNGNYFGEENLEYSKDGLGPLRYAASFTPDQTIQLKDIEIIKQ